MFKFFARNQEITELTAQWKHVEDVMQVGAPVCDCCVCVCLSVCVQCIVGVRRRHLRADPAVLAPWLAAACLLTLAGCCPILLLLLLTHRYRDACLFAHSHAPVSTSPCVLPCRPQW